jgi:poly(3-hydroxybutyrate) depolymerase
MRAGRTPVRRGLVTADAMIYQVYQAQSDLLQPLKALGRMGASLARIYDFGAHTPAFTRQLGAASALLAEAGMTHARPDFGIPTVRVGDQDIAVTEEIALDTPFASLLHFRKDMPEPGPRVLLVAPMSGHFATLLRATLQTMLRDHDVYITDWKNARDIPLSDGIFDLDAFVDHLMKFMVAIGPGAHMVAVCQPTVAALAAVAVMAEEHEPAQPRSLTLMAGPIDTRINPTRVNQLAKSKSIEWFEKNLIGRVPWRYKGAHRRVYPGFMQLSAFMTMNLDRHINAHVGQFHALAQNDHTKSVAHRKFYQEYGAVMDLPAEFFLQTVQRIFQDHDLPLGRLTWRGRPIRPELIRRTALLTVEGERDDICAIGQTLAALDLCTGVRVSMKRHHLQTGVGHYGVFSGRRWEQEVYPRVRSMIQALS